MDHGIIDTTVIIVLDEQWYPACLRGQTNRAQTEILKGVDK